MLLAFTDRLPARRIYLIGTGLTALSHLGFALLADGFWSGFLMRALAGVGWAGAYMPGLKAIADPLEGAAQSRAVSWHAAGVGIAGAVSFAVAGLWNAVAGPQSAFLFGAAAAGMAFLIAAAIMPGTLTRRAAASGILLDLRPVFRNRHAMAWITGYTVHTWELAALRAWGVTFITVTIARLGAPAWLPSADVMFMLTGLAGVAISVTGNETAQRYGRNRVVLGAMLTAAALSLVAGWTTGISVTFAVVAVLIWNMAIYIDSSALTAGTVQAAVPHLRGATMGVHSMAGYAGGFIGPLGVGLVLDLYGGDSVAGWGIGFGHIAIVTMVGLLILRKLGGSEK